MAATRSPLIVPFGQKLRACRTRLGISREELGFRTIIKLARALEMTLGELFEGVDWKSEEGFTLPGLGDVPVK